MSPNLNPHPPDYTVAAKRTIASRSEPIHYEFFRSVEAFLQHAESQVPDFTVDATNQPVLEAVLAYFVRDGFSVRN